jgi:hypothetical protein
MSQEGVQAHEQLANELLLLQEKENNGRGINCIRDIATYWHSGDIESARQIASTDNDKIRNYPIIQQWLEDNLFGPEVDSPMKLEARIRNWAGEKKES